jgi:adenosylcobinamide-GDP ribazoletransferase
MQYWRKLQAALIFYTCLPLKIRGNLDFRGIAVYAPLVGLGIGTAIAAVDWGLSILRPEANLLHLRSLLAICIGLLITGGLHLDGAMDTADGLAVTEPSRRLEVMADSHTGAFGAIAAIVILLGKVIALAAIDQERSLVLVSLWGWSRWGQLRAIMQYPYLKAVGKGKFHREQLYHWQVWLMAILLIGINLLMGYSLQVMYLAMGLIAIGMGMAWLIGAWLNQKLGGHTGDTYGAIVEWTETLGLVAIALIY